MIGRRTFTAILGSAFLALTAQPASPPMRVARRNPPSPPAPTASSAPSEVTSTGSVTIGGKAVSYKAIAGTLVVHGPGWDDVAWREQAAAPNPDKDKEGLPPETSMFYTAYFGQGEGGKQGGNSNRPLMFIYNGGPGSATLWLHMGAFGPRRVVVREDGHTPPAPTR